MYKDSFLDPIRGRLLSRLKHRHPKLTSREKWKKINSRTHTHFYMKASRALCKSRAKRTLISLNWQDVSTALPSSLGRLESWKLHNGGSISEGKRRAHRKSPKTEKTAINFVQNRKLKKSLHWQSFGRLQNLSFCYLIFTFLNLFYFPKFFLRISLVSQNSL